MRPHNKLILRTDKYLAGDLGNAMNRRAFMRRITGGVAGITALGMAPFLQLESKAFVLPEWAVSIVASGILPTDSTDLMKLVDSYVNTAQVLVKTAADFLVKLEITAEDFGRNLKSELVKTPFNQVRIKDNAPTHEKNNPPFLPQKRGDVVGPQQTHFNLTTYLSYSTFPLLLPVKVAKAAAKTAGAMNVDELNLVHKVYENAQTQLHFAKKRMSVTDAQARNIKENLSNGENYGDKAKSDPKNYPSAESLQTNYFADYLRPITHLVEDGEKAGKKIYRWYEDMVAITFRPKEEAPKALQAMIIPMPMQVLRAV